MYICKINLYKFNQLLIITECTQEDLIILKESIYIVGYYNLNMLDAFTDPTIPLKLW